MPSSYEHRPEEGETYEFSLDDEDFSFSVRRANDVVTEGLDEICEKIAGALDGSGIDFPEYVPVSLTGGGLSYMRGAREYLAKRLSRVVEIVHPALPHLNKPSQSSELGLLDLALSQKPKRTGFLKKLFS